MMSATSIRDRIIVALDVSSMDEAERLLQQLQGSAVYFKVGMELFYAAGPNIIHSLKERELKVFLDLKCHDIPNTVRGAMRSMAQLGVDMVNFHVSGGRRMMEAALEGLEEGAARGKQRPLIIGVTQLTSTSQEMLNREIGIQGTVEEVVAHYARLAKDAGLDGVVASPLEVPMIKEKCGADFLTVTPGIRPKGSEKEDQTRVTTPEEAFRKGSDYIVMGRAITRADDPGKAFETIVENVCSANQKER